MRSILLAGGLLSLTAQAFALTIVPNYINTGAGSWDANEQAVMAQAIADWQSVITDNVTINVNVDFTNAGTGGYLGQWNGSYSGAFVGDDIYPWQKSSHSIHFNADLMSGTNYLWFDPTPTTSTDQPFAAWDALSVARHEIGHMLGFVSNFYTENIGISSGPNQQVILWDRFITGTTFDQPGLNVALYSDLSHLAPAGVDGDLMAPALYNGTRKYISDTDLDMLSKAYGYTLVPEPGIVGFAMATALLTLCRRKRD